MPTEAENALLSRLRRDGMTDSFALLDEHGWAMARAVLRVLAERSKYPMNGNRRAG